MVLARRRAISSYPRRLSRYRQERAEREWVAVPGLGLILEGVPRIGALGELVMVEPSFEIVAGPQHG